MTGMLDTNVLIYAFSENSQRQSSSAERRRRATESADIAAMIDASKRLIAKQGIVRVSAISMVEFMRRIRQHEEGPYLEISQRLEVIAVDRVIAEKAAQMMRTRDGATSGKVCRRCLNCVDTHECGECKRFVPSTKRLNDAIIVATAELHDKVNVLYSFDGHLSRGFGSQMKNCQIIDPRSVDAPPKEAEPKAPVPKATLKGTKPAGQTSLFDRINSGEK